ncbi:MAG: hypothetical protein RLZZ400_817 [Actinomycetota bacterium]
MMNSLLESVSKRFAEAGIDSARNDAELLLAHLLKLGKGELQAKLVSGEIELSPEQSEAFEVLVTRREAREPLQHLTGEAHFRTLTLEVGKGVFVPRPETEYVTGLAIDGIRTMNLDSPTVVDLCAGSGAIGLAIATEIADARVFAVEKSEDAYPFASRNYARIAPERGEVVLGDLDGAFPQLNGTVDWLISNPPYIPADMIPVYPEVALHDPSLALYAGHDGLDVIRLVSKNALRLVRVGGGLTIEHADMQGSQVRQLLLDDGWHDVQTHQDFNGRDRATTAIR